eukprot:TRINITY_DN3910_c0_g1_i5.p2 TRINITY_DN3910_c0_g1~~TRINITY_DN3910_c0_g1_i5.p2  ORF type:complete len:408 (+),score=87.44 TRINITY_DN3910_c0_g1_i5:55-1278(+)
MGGAASKKSHNQLASEDQVRRKSSFQKGGASNAKKPTTTNAAQQPNTSNPPLPPKAPSPSPQITNASQQKPSQQTPESKSIAANSVENQTNATQASVSLVSQEKEKKESVIHEQKSEQAEMQKSSYSSPESVSIPENPTASNASIIRNDSLSQSSSTKTLLLPKGKLRMITSSVSKIKRIEEDRHVRIFISSTFADMQPDRNALFLHTFPLLHELCVERGITMTEVDLRWGITSDESESGKVIEICLNEINNSYLLCLLGERYGWVPNRSDPREWSTDLHEKFPWLESHTDISVTEMEIRHGALNQQPVAKKSFFYFRLGQQFMSQSAQHASKQQSLKDEIERQFPVRKYADPLSLSRIVLEDFKKMIEESFPASADADVHALEKQAHSLFAQSRRVVFHGRQDAIF